MNALLPRTHRGEDLQWALTEFWAEHPDPNALLEAFDPELMDHTLFMAGHGVSHRPDFPLQVGAVIIGKTSQGPVLFEGYNYSPYRGSEKDCAEIRGLRMGDELVADEFQHGLIVPISEAGVLWQAFRVMVAASSTRHTNFGINGLEAPTLHPCAALCQPQLARHPAVADDILVQTIAVDLHTHGVLATEEHTLAAMRAMYRGVAIPLTSKQELAQAADN